MSVVTITQEGRSLDRVNKILAGIPGGAWKAAHSALRRAGDTAKTRAGQFAAAEYAINKSTFMRNVTEKSSIGGGAGGVASMKLSYAGRVIPLLEFHTNFSHDGRVQTQVKRSGGASTLDHAFVARIYGPAAVFERLGTSRFPVEQKFGPSTGHMMQNEAVVEKMEKTVQETFDQRIEHEIARVLNGWGG